MSELVTFVWGSGEHPVPGVVSDPAITSVEVARLRAITELRRRKKTVTIKMIGVTEPGKLIRVNHPSGVVTGIVTDVNVRLEPSGKLISEVTLDVLS